MEKKYDFKTMEKEMQLLWDREGIYTYQNKSGKKVFSIDTPPPTVSGSLHIGHVFSYTQAEMIARFKRMQNFEVFYPFGFDDNGLPTERLVEREENLRAMDLPRSEFKERCIHTISQYEEDFRSMWNRLGFSVDWSLQYQTISESSQRISQRSFLELVKKKKAYMKESPVLWCTQCQTSIAQAELETKDCETTFYYLRFMVSDQPLIIATTRPELLCGCVSVFVHPEDSRYQEFIGKDAKVPIYGFEVPIMADDQVGMEKGTGVVMCSTFGDSMDVEWFAKHNLPYRKTITEAGYLSSEVPFLGGLKVKQARTKIIEKLREEDFIVNQEAITHSIAIHERCGTDTEILLSKQWYIDVMTEKELFLKAADEINWYPEYMKNRYQIWVQNLKWDWCISRQRYFGVPFPVWYCKSCQAPAFAEDDQLPVNPLEDKPKHACSYCGGTEFVPESAVFDTWATSSVTPLINAKYGEADDRMDEIFPMGMRCQAHEIIRTWAFYTIVKSLYHTGQLPWKDIMISGFVLAKPGEKISKSKQNASNSPTHLIETHSADAIRYWAANAKLGTDMYFNEEELKISKRFITKLYNAASFAILHLEDYKNPVDKVDLLPVDLWILARVNEVTRKATKLLNEYEIGQARHEIDDLFWHDFCDNYIEIVKERLYQPEKHGYQERYSGQYALYHSLYGILKLYAIYTPHITDYIYQQFFRKFEPETSIHNTVWESKEEDKRSLEFGEQLIGVLSEVRKLKSEKQLSMKDEIPEVVIECPEDMKGIFQKTEKDIRACTNAKEIRYQ